MIATEIHNAYNQTKWALLLRGLLSLAVGIVILARPMDSVVALALVIALWSLFDGIVGIVRSPRLRATVAFPESSSKIIGVALALEVAILIAAAIECRRIRRKG